jgi:hypothetical protein
MPLEVECLGECPWYVLGMPLTLHLGNVETLVMVDLDCVRPLPGRALPITCFLFLLLFSSFLLIWRLDMAGCLIPARTDAVGHNLFPWGTGRI